MGDWTGKGYDTVGVCDPQTSVFYLKDTHTSGGPDHAIHFAPKKSGALPLSGDWLDKGLSGIGLYDPSSGEIRLRKTLTEGSREYAQTFVAGLKASLLRQVERPADAKSAPLR